MSILLLLNKSWNCTKQIVFESFMNLIFVMACVIYQLRTVLAHMNKLLNLFHQSLNQCYLVLVPIVASRPGDCATAISNFLRHTPPEDQVRPCGGDVVTSGVLLRVCYGSRVASSLLLIGSQCASVLRGIAPRGST